jgi:hypothetical protein
MTARGRKDHTKHLLSATGRHHLKALELQGRQTSVEKNSWNYNEFVTRLLEIIVVLHIGDKQKSVPPKE